MLEHVCQPLARTVDELRLKVDAVDSIVHRRRSPDTLEGRAGCDLREEIASAAYRDFDLLCDLAMLRVHPAENLPGFTDEFAQRVHCVHRAVERPILRRLQCRFGRYARTGDRVNHDTRGLVGQARRARVRSGPGHSIAAAEVR
ncbi:MULTISPECIES: hypothetical protein [Burkholderia]|uniref:Uncharacterized protein n=1 Tax=Burkholderia contaminans TaxID=488447 RepID=A0AAP1V0J0_9BURK|nr:MULTISPECIES: hypothetical protein [Burkholderia]UTP24682.1 hypothetical protein NMB33_29980 [Burkholderia sp. FXe9]MBH9689344.1 hypothetical protein [Burkholderia contaminans]MBK1900090.1 hypothetical protein [Burkholderia contaminans]MBK1907643.1 hypothetical protein [Burkholderia contaminans]MBK1920306.1 hypothetical protein [Burkholderia contaminans]